MPMSVIFCFLIANSSSIANSSISISINSFDSGLNLPTPTLMMFSILLEFSGFFVLYVIIVDCIVILYSRLLEIYDLLFQRMLPADFILDRNCSDHHIYQISPFPYTSISLFISQSFRWKKFLNFTFIFSGIDSCFPLGFQLKRYCHCLIS